MWMEKYNVKEMKILGFNFVCISVLFCVGTNIKFKWLIYKCSSIIFIDFRLNNFIYLYHVLAVPDFIKFWLYFCCVQAL